jgi:hypothetical protein
MTRDEVLKEYGIDQWDVMADEIVRLCRILSALREPSEAMVKAVDAALVHAPTRADVFRELIRRAVEAAEQEASNASD